LGFCGHFVASIGRPSSALGFTAVSRGWSLDCEAGGFVFGLLVADVLLLGKVGF
jgi:hypothetical protein